MSRSVLISSLAITILVLAGAPGDAATRHGSGKHHPARHAHVRHHPHHRTVQPAKPADPWADWAARWSSEVGNCPTGWYCYPMGND